MFSINYHIKSRNWTLKIHQKWNFAFLKNPNLVCLLGIMHKLNIEYARWKKPIIFYILKSSLKCKRGNYVTMLPGTVHLWRRGFLAYSTVFGGEHAKAVSVGLFKWYAYEATSHIFPCRCGILYCCAHDGYDMIRWYDKEYNNTAQCHLHGQSSITNTPFTVYSVDWLLMWIMTNKYSTWVSSYKRLLVLKQACVCCYVTLISVGFQK